MGAVVKVPFCKVRTMDWNSAPAFGRRETLLRTLQKLAEVHPGPVCLVETGTLRDDNPRALAGDGWSTLAFGWYAAQTGGRLYTVDCDPAALEVCQRLTAPYAAHIDYVCADSLAFFAQWVAEERGPIHLLYLDSLDYHDPARSEAHHLAEAQAALPALAPDGLILFDDTYPLGAAGSDGVPLLVGKGARAVPFLLEQGLRLQWCADGQALLRSEKTLEPQRRRDAEKGRLNRRGAETRRKTQRKADQDPPSSLSSLAATETETRAKRLSTTPLSLARNERPGRGGGGEGETRGHDRAFRMP